MQQTQFTTQMASDTIPVVAQIYGWITLLVPIMLLLMLILLFIACIMLSVIAARAREQKERLDSIEYYVMRVAHKDGRPDELSYRQVQRIVKDGGKK